MPDTDLEIRGGGGGGDHPDPPLDKGSPVSKNFFPLFGPQLGLKIRGGPGPSPGSATEVSCSNMANHPFSNYIY